ncbi:MAG: ABC transporter substrate-binding protein [Promethearchaeota archaeon]
MKKTKIVIFLFCFLTISMFVPVIFVSAQSNSAQLKLSLIKADDNSTMIAAGGATTFGWWDPTTYYFSAGDWMLGHALETLFTAKADTTNTLDEYIPLLATDYDIVETWPSEENSLGWNNTGGIHILDVHLRENVKFHDGSEWNATVCKWNFDRYIVLMGNLTGNQIWTQWKHNMYRPARDYHDFYTKTWNHSSYYGNDPDFGTPVTPEYYGKDNDPNSSWTSVSKTQQVEGWYPIINKTLVVKNASETASGTGGTVRFEFNDWQTGLNYISLLNMISMETYEKYFDVQIFDNYDGLGLWLGGTPLVGTGPYKYKNLDTVSTLRATMERFDDYWNFTAMRDAGLMIVKDAIVQFYTGALTQQERTTAILSGDVDFADDGPYGPLYPEQITTSTSVDYFDAGIADSTEQIVFRWDNTDKTLRTAIGYAFNYSKYIAIAQDGRAVVSDSPFGTNSHWKTPSIVGPSYDLSIARQTLLNDPFYGSLLANQSITASSSTQDWNDFADDIAAGTLNSTFLKAFTLNYWSDIYVEDFANIFETSIKDIGMVFNSSAEWKLTGIQSVFDKLLAGVTRVWAPVEPYFSYLECFLMDWPMPRLEIGYLDAYITSVSYYYAPYFMWLDISETWNYGDVNNKTLTNMIHSLYLQDSINRQDTYDDIAEFIYDQNPHVYLTQDEVGYAVSKKFSVDWSWNVFNFGYVGIGPGIPEAGVEIIPGFPSYTILIISILSTVAIGVRTIRKNKLKSKF